MSLAADTPAHIPAAGRPRHDWTREEIRALFDLPFPELMFRAQSVHRQNFDPAEVQISTLLSIKTGGCPEDCAYCPQSARYDTGVRAEKLMALDAVLAEARAAKSAGASRFCMGAAWREPKDRDLDSVCAMVEGVKALGLETCATLGMLTAPQARRLKDAGLDYYNHNLDTSPEFYDHDHHHADLSGSPGDARPCARSRHPCLLRRHRRHGRDARGPRRHDCDAGDSPGASGIGADQYAGQGRRHAARRRAACSTRIEFVRTIAVARIAMPRSVVRLSAGREDMSEETQALVFSRRRQFDFLWAEAPHHAQSRPRPRPRADGQARHVADGMISLRATSNFCSAVVSTKST